MSAAKRMYEKYSTGILARKRSPSPSNKSSKMPELAVSRGRFISKHKFRVDPNDLGALSVLQHWTQERINEWAEGTELPDLKEGRLMVDACCHSALETRRGCYELFVDYVRAVVSKYQGESQGCALRALMMLFGSLDCHYTELTTEKPHARRSRKPTNELCCGQSLQVVVHSILADYSWAPEYYQAPRAATAPASPGPKDFVHRSQRRGGVSEGQAGPKAGPRPGSAEEPVYWEAQRKARGSLGKEPSGGEGHEEAGYFLISNGQGRRISYREAERTGFNQFSDVLVDPPAAAPYPALASRHSLQDILAVSRSQSRPRMASPGSPGLGCGGNLDPDPYREHDGLREFADRVASSHTHGGPPTSSIEEIAKRIRAPKAGMPAGESASMAR